MADGNAVPDVNLDDIAKEISGLSQEQLMAEVLKTRVRQKKQQKKQQGSGAQKQYQLRQRERFKLLKAEAQKLGLWEKINDQAEEEAEKQLRDEEGAEVEVAEEA